MAVLLDYTDYYFLKKESVINNKDLSFYSYENSILRFVIKKNTSKKLSFFINPMINALSFKPEIIVKDSDIFELKINASLLPKNWSGDLIINDAGMINTIELNFSKKEL
ncbi:MAG: hypothetical protein PHN56_04895 [Candidatus Nanoarchaeia archaeon]|nr:hypothetical protein [Candidatus Nanoarchaeia archaeon]